MNRLTNEDRNGAGERYAYDLCGNRLLKERYSGSSVDVTEGYRYNERNELTERIRAGRLTAYHYDKNGSLVLEEEEGRKSEYRYDLLNRQTYVKTLDGREQENLYDGEGLRAGLTENGKKITFLYHNGEIFSECDGDNAPIRRYVRGNGLSCVQTLDNNAYHAYHQDEQGSTAYITWPDNAAENCYQYDAFGNLTEKKEGIENRILYTGQQYDQETGQYYLRARYYNPVVGRFLQEDTCRVDGLNLYAYCVNNPVLFYDPSGNMAQYGNGGPQGSGNTQAELAGKDKKTTEGFEEWLNKGEADTHVYFGMNNGEAEYTGITKQTNEARLYQHTTSKTNKKELDDLITQYENLTRNQARAIEQHFIENEKGPNKQNKIWSISKDNKYYEDAKDWAEKYLKSRGKR